MFKASEIAGSIVCHWSRSDTSSGALINMNLPSNIPHQLKHDPQCTAITQTKWQSNNQNGKLQRQPGPYTPTPWDPKGVVDKKFGENGIELDWEPSCLQYRFLSWPLWISKRRSLPPRKRGKPYYRLNALTEKRKNTHSTIIEDRPIHTLQSETSNATDMLTNQKTPPLTISQDCLGY